MKCVIVKCLLFEKTVTVNCFAHQYKSITLDDTVDESFENIDRCAKQY